MAAKTSKGKKPARKSSPAARSAKPAKRAAAKPARAAAKPTRTARASEPEGDVVYSDIRRSMHGAILRHLR
jgi:hypothetical protein